MSENTIHIEEKKTADPYQYIGSANKNDNYYALGMFPYPSGKAHLGHIRVYSIVDIVSRHRKLKGLNVLNPIGWDSFGLPAENAAISRKVHPRAWTMDNIYQMKNFQFNKVGFSFDWTKELTTSNPDYYRWTQWIFLQLFKKGLAYKKEEYVNWCPIDQTVLANEQVIDGKSWRHGVPVEKKKLNQWFIRITDYADRLWDGLETLNEWNKEAVLMQKNWIGKSKGNLITFDVDAESEQIDVFTTKIETLFGVSAVVISPEHPICDRFQDNPTIYNFIQECIKKDTKDRLSNEDKSGIFTGLEAIHPLDGRKVPIWIGDYVLSGYGTGAVMCVPAHDKRDYDFAMKYDLDVFPVLSDKEGLAYNEGNCPPEDGLLINSGDFSNLSIQTARNKLTEALQKIDKGKWFVNYNLKDWSIGRQRYWGCPIPIIYCESCGPVPCKESELPITLPEDVQFEDGRIRIDPNSAFYDVECPNCGKNAKRETDTLDTFMDSSWYAYRFIDAKNQEKIFDTEKVNNIMPIDFYVGGLEHAAQHMLYFRFINKFFKDIGLIDFEEPVKQFFCNGMVKLDGSKMSKSKGNIVEPSEIIEKFGADSLRLYIVSDYPSDYDIDWSEQGIKSKHKFIANIERTISNFLQTEMVHSTADKLDIRDVDAPTLEKIKEYIDLANDIDKTYKAIKFNVSVAKMYEAFKILAQLIKDPNTLDPSSKTFLIKSFLIVSSPIIPITTNALYTSYFEEEKDIYNATWPSFPDIQVQKMVNINVLVNGKRKMSIEASPGLSGQQVAEQLQSIEKFNQLQVEDINSHYFVQDKLINFVPKKAAKK